MTRKPALDDGWTRLPELEERTDGAKLVPSPENVAVLTGRRATSLMSTALSVASLSAHSITASVQWRFLSHASLALPPPKMKDRRTEIMMTILLIHTDGNKYNDYFHSAICLQKIFHSIHRNMFVAACDIRNSSSMRTGLPNGLKGILSCFMFFIF